jgi:hypothetical protein
LGDEAKHGVENLLLPIFCQLRDQNSLLLPTTLERCESIRWNRNKATTHKTPMWKDSPKAKIGRWSTNCCTAIKQKQSHNAKASAAELPQRNPVKLSLSREDGGRGGRIKV